MNLKKNRKKEKERINTEIKQSPQRTFTKGILLKRPTHVCPRSREKAKFARVSVAPLGLDNAKVTPLSLAPALPFPDDAIPPM